MSEVARIARPLLAPWHRVVYERERVVLEYGGEALSLEGRAARTLLPALLPLLDGYATVDEIAIALGEEKRPAIEQALMLLETYGVLTEGPPLPAALPQPFATAALLHAANDAGAPSPRAVRRRLRRASVMVVGSGSAALEVTRALRLSGLGRVDRGTWEAPDAADLVVVALAASEVASLAAWNEAALAAGTRWLQVLPYNGRFAAVGPLYVPTETCCYECYRRRRAANVDYPDAFWALEHANGGVRDAPALATAVGGLAALACLRWLVSADPFSTGVMHAVEALAGVRVTSHVVYRVPRCPACSVAARTALPLPWAEAS